MSAPVDVGTILGGLLRTSPPRGLVSAYLFGSHAAGRAHRDSDVDVAVLLAWDVYPDARQRFEERVRLSSALAVDLRTDRIDVVVLNDAPPGLGRRIVTEGRRVFCSDPERDHASVRDVQLRAADLDPFLRRTRRIKLSAIRR
jgi:predicted nucleotidyltransferase